MCKKKSLGIQSVCMYVYIKYTWRVVCISLYIPVHIYIFIIIYVHYIYIYVHVFIAWNNSVFLKKSGPYRKVSQHLLKTFSWASLVMKVCQSFSAFPTIKACTVNLPGNHVVRFNEIWQLIDVRCSFEFGNPITSFPFKAEVNPVNTTVLPHLAIQSEGLQKILLQKSLTHR